jgi:hypothetical protein
VNRVLMSSLEIIHQIVYLNDNVRALLQALFS